MSPETVQWGMTDKKREEERRRVTYPTVSLLRVDTEYQAR